jgi:hypothetical protein
MTKLGARNAIDLARIVMSNGQQFVPEITSALRPHGPCEFKPTYPQAAGLLRRLPD